MTGKRIFKSDQIQINSGSKEKNQTRHEKITFEEIEAFVREHMNNAPLFATQKKVSAVIIKRNILKLADGEVAPAIHVKNAMIINGHHRYIAGMMYGKLPEDVQWEAPSSIEILKWQEILVEFMDWNEGS